MDEGVVKESGNDTIDDEELILPNRNLRDKVEENSVRSPRKSPRLMAQGNYRRELARKSNVGTDVIEYKLVILIVFSWCLLT